MKRKSFYLFSIGLLFAVVLVFQGCYPDDSLTAEQTDIVFTTYNDSVDFSKVSTYFMKDTVYVLGDEENTTPLDEEISSAILNKIADNMANSGYTRITEEDQGKPDVVILVGAFTSTTVSVGWWYPYYPYWGGYPGWGWGGWPGYYPPGYYPPYPVYSSYTTGTVVWDMTNPDDYDIIEGDTLARVYWNAGIQGVLNGGDPVGRIERGIDQAFKQSPEIKHN